MDREHVSAATESERVDAVGSDAALAYQVAVDLWIHEAELIWSKFNAMLVANSVILATIGFTAGSRALSPALKFGLPAGGIALCAVWGVLLRRGFDYNRYWILSAREVEESCLSDAVQTVARGAAFSSGQHVQFKFGGRLQGYRMSGMSRTLRASWASYSVVAVFIALYLGFLLLT